MKREANKDLAKRFTIYPEDELKRRRDDMRKLAANHQRMADDYEKLAIALDAAILLKREGKP